MNANVYSVVKDGIIPFICVWVKKGNELIVKKSVAQGFIGMGDVLKFKEETDLKTSKAFIITKQKQDLEIVPSELDFPESVPNKSMLNRRKKVRTK